MLFLTFFVLFLLLLLVDDVVVHENNWVGSCVRPSK